MPPSPTPADQMRATGSGRRKVALEPGFSQLDWVRESAKLKIAPHRSISLEELQSHNTVDDVWLAVNGKVYNMTPYLRYHPGGIPILMATAGKVCVTLFLPCFLPFRLYTYCFVPTIAHICQDATSLFYKYHAWLNLDFMLVTCCLGTLDTTTTTSPN